MKQKPANEAHEVAYQDMITLIRKHENELTSMDLLAIAANLVGKLIAMQDQTTITPGIVMEIVMKNIQEGNIQAIQELIDLETEGSA